MSNVNIWRQAAVILSRHTDSGDFGLPHEASAGCHGVMTSHDHIVYVHILDEQHSFKIDWIFYT